MAQRLRCPDCKTTFTAPEAEAAAVRCPSCSRRLAGTGAIGKAEKWSEPGSPDRKERSARTEKPRKPRRKLSRESNPTLLIVGSIMGGLLIIGLGTYGLIRAFGKRSADPEKVAVKPEPGPEDKKDHKPPFPVPPDPIPEDAPWEVKPDPAPKDAEPAAIPETLRVALGGRPVFASGGGPFVLDDSREQKAPSPIYDLRTGKQAGALAASNQARSAPHLLLSPDGQYATGYNYGDKSVEVWKPGAEQPACRLELDGRSWVRWLDFRSANELVTVFSDLTVMKVQNWSLPDGKLLGTVELRQGRDVENKPFWVDGTLSPGRRYLAMAGGEKFCFVDLKAGRVAGTLPRLPDGGFSGLAFSEDGAELLGLYSEKDPDNRHLRKGRLLGWGMADGKPTVDAALDLHPSSYMGPPLPGPDRGTLLLVGGAEKNGITLAQGQVVDRDTAARIIDLPYTPVRWLGEGKLLAHDPVDRSVLNQKRAVHVRAFDRAAYDARAGAARLAAAPRPEPKAADRSAVRRLRPEPAGWAVKIDPRPDGAAPKAGVVKEAEAYGDVIFAGPTSGVVAVVFTKKQEEARRRTTLRWSRFDAVGGKRLGEAVELWPWIDRPAKAPADPPQTRPLTPALSDDGKRLALRDPADARRVDVFEADGGHVLGLVPGGEAPVDWLGWARDGRLLTLGGGKLTAWEVPAGRAVYEVEGGYGQGATLSAGRSWVAVGGTGHVDVLDAGTGACLGRLEAPDTPAKDWTALAVSADGKRLAGVAAVVGTVKVPRTVRVWELGNGATARTMRLGPGNWTRLDWCGERHVLVAGGELVDLGLGAVVAECQPTGFSAGGLISGSPDGRLWYLARNSDANVETSAWSLLASTFTNPRTLKEVPGAAPAEREVVFYPGLEVAVEADFPNPAVKETAGTAMASLLRQEGFKVGPGSGWRLQVKGEEFDSNSRLTLEDRTTMVVPAVRGQVRLIGPDGKVAGGGESHGVSLNIKSKYETKKVHQNGELVTYYDFRGRNPRQALLEEFWERWLATLERVQWPRGVMRVQGKYEPLPPTITLAMDPPGS